jgi:hypothetical protein
MAVSKTGHPGDDRSWLSTLSIPALRPRPTSHTQENKRTHTSKPRFVLVPLLAMLSITCSFGGVLPDGSGPIVSMTAGNSVNQQEQATDSKFTFDPAAPQMAVVVQVGQLSSPASMTITWYQVTDQGDQKLFTDTVQVSALDRAYSIGKNPGTLAEGDYKIVAALNGQTQQVELKVAQPAPSPLKSQSQTAPPNTSQAQKGQPPVSGGSGAIPTHADPALPAPTPEGDHWTGTVRSTSMGDYGSAGTCSNEIWVSKFDAYVSIHRNFHTGIYVKTVSGSGSGHRTGGPDCVGLAFGPQSNSKVNLASSITFDVTGQFDANTFYLFFHETDMNGATPGLINYSFLQNIESVLEPLFEFKVTGKGSAGGSITIKRPVPDSKGATATGLNIIDMLCVNCK